MTRYANHHKESAIRGRVTRHSSAIDLLRAPKTHCGNVEHGLGKADLAEVPQLSDRALAIVNAELLSWDHKRPIHEQTIAAIDAELSACVAVLREVKRRRVKAIQPTNGG